MTSYSDQYDVLIIGQGAAAFAAALYAARYQMKTIIIGESVVRLIDELPDANITGQGQGAVER